MKSIRYGRTISYWRRIAMFLTDTTVLKALLSIRCPADFKEVYEGIEILLHDSIYETAQRCAILPSRLHMDEVQTMATVHVNGGGFADIYKGTLSDGRVIALKVPRCFGKPDEIRKVHAVSYARISCRRLFLPLWRKSPRKEFCGTFRQIEMCFLYSA